jgi:hypothetical protein
MGKRILNWMCLVGVAVMVAGCISTPAKRIAKDPELFGSFPPEIQASIRKGEVAIGFTPEMAQMALGSPHRVVERSTTAGETELWLYMGMARDTTMQPVSSSYMYRDRYGRLRQAYDTHWVSVDRTREYPVLRLEFEAGRVKSIEKIK